MNDDYRAAEAVAALQSIDAGRIEYKANVDIPALSVDGREVTTLWSVDCLDDVGDITPVSAFSSVLTAKPESIPHLFMHEITQPAIAVVRKVEPVTRADLPSDVQAAYPEATGGMSSVSTFLSTPRADEIFQGIKAGIPYQASFGYRVLQSTPHRQIKRADGKPARVLNQLYLYEISTTHSNHAAQPATRVRLGKALALLEEYKAALEGIKAGRRHSETDMAWIRQGVELARQIMNMFDALGADNLQPIVVAGPPATVERTPTVELIADIRSILGVSNEQVSVHAASGIADAATGR